MKKTICLLLALFITLSLFAGIGGGYSISPVGEKFGDENFGGAAISGYFSPTGLKNIGKMEGDILFSMKSPVFRGVNLTISTPIYQTVDHPFNYVFSNIVLWQPTIGLGMEYRMGNEVRAMVEISPFVFQDAAFMYEILSPYISFDFNGNWGWGITVMKFSASFGRLN
ncbi:MAG: hypothetical protein MSS69_00650 [Spirochaetales bacterium]|nr:hypothetical protein [Spirochaetales bacterium]